LFEKIAKNNMIKLIVVVLCLSAFVAFASGYGLVHNYTGSNFFNDFDFFTGGDPTHGYVYYASKDQANAWGYTSVSNNVVYIRSDHTSVASGSGRGSVRLTSGAQYSHGLFIFDVVHMPYGCGTWPAIWTVGANWPYNGEIDVIEGVNQNNRNQMTLHSGPGCTMPTNWDQTGKTTFADCNCAGGANGNSGCGVQAPTNSYGVDFNNNGGGVYAMQYEDSGVFIWFFPRNAIPSDIRGHNPNPASWGTPTAAFPFAGTGPGTCPRNSFSNHQIVIDNTFCGDWAGSVFNQDGCSGSCQSFVQNNPSAFNEAYWAINSIAVYQ